MIRSLLDSEIPSVAETWCMLMSTADGCCLAQALKL